MFRTQNPVINASPEEHATASRLRRPRRPILPKATETALGFPNPDSRGSRTGVVILQIPVSQ
jgi:hypothetical protein